MLERCEIRFIRIGIRRLIGGVTRLVDGSLIDSHTKHIKFSGGRGATLKCMIRIEFHFSPSAAILVVVEHNTQGHPCTYHGTSAKIIRKKHPHHDIFCNFMHALPHSVYVERDYGAADRMQSTEISVSTMRASMLTCGWMSNGAFVNFESALMAMIWRKAIHHQCERHTQPKTFRLDHK